MWKKNSLLLVAILAVIQNVWSQPSYLDLIGKSLPNLTLRTFEGNIISTADLAGSGVVVNFWSTTCRPCIEEIPDLNRLKSEFDDVIFLAVAPESKARIEYTLIKHPFNFNIIPNGGEFLNKLGIKSFPVTLFVDKHGIIRHIEIGAPSVQNPKTGKFESYAYDHYRYFMPKILVKK